MWDNLRSGLTDIFTSWMTPWFSLLHLYQPLQDVFLRVIGAVPDLFSGAWQ